MKFLTGFLVGALFGAVAALLFAPERGEDLRARLRLESEREYRKLQDQLQQGMHQLQEQADRLSSEVKSAAQKVDDAGHADQSA